MDPAVTKFRLTVAHAAKWSEQMRSVLVVAEEASVAEVQLHDGQSLFVLYVPVVERVVARQPGIAVARVLAACTAHGRVSLVGLTLRLQAARALA